MNEPDSIHVAGRLLAAVRRAAPLPLSRIDASVAGEAAPGQRGIGKLVASEDIDADNLSADEEEVLFAVLDPPWLRQSEQTAELRLAAEVAGPAKAKRRAEVMHGEQAVLTVVVTPGGHILLVLESRTNPATAIPGAEVRIELVHVAGRASTLAKGRTDSSGKLIIGAAAVFAAPGSREYYRVRASLPRKPRNGEDG